MVTQSGCKRVEPYSCNGFPEPERATWSQRTYRWMSPRWTGYVQTVDFSACQATAGATSVDRSCSPSRGPDESVLSLSLPRLADYISTVYKHVSYRRERPIGAIGAVRARAGTRMLIPCMSLVRGGTQHMSLSAANVQTQCSG